MRILTVPPFFSSELSLSYKSFSKTGYQKTKEETKKHTVDDSPLDTCVSQIPKSVVAQVNTFVIEAAGNVLYNLCSRN